MAGFARALSGGLQGLGKGLVQLGEERRQAALEALRAQNAANLENLRSSNTRAEDAARIDATTKSQVTVDTARTENDIKVEGVRQKGAAALEATRSANQIKETAARVGMEEGAEIRKEKREEARGGPPKERRAATDDEAKRIKDMLVQRATTTAYDEESGKNVERTDWTAVEKALRAQGRDSSGYRFATAPRDPKQRKVGYDYMAPNGRIARWTAQGWLEIPEPGQKAKPAGQK